MLRRMAALMAHTGVRRHFFNTSWMFGEHLLRLLSGLLVGIWVARYLGPSQLGAFSYALAFAALFSGIAKLGLDAILVRELVNDPARRNLFLGTAFWLKLGGGLLSLVLVGLVLLSTPHDALTRIYILIISSGVLFQSFEVIDAYFQSQVMSRYVSLARMTQLLLSSLLRIYLVLTGGDLIYFVVVSLIDQITLAVALYIAYRKRQLGSFFCQFDWNIGKQLLRNSWPMMFSSLLIMIYLRIDQIMIRNMLGEQSLGIYTAAVRLSEVWYVIPMVITSSLFPAIVNARKHSPELYMMRLQKLYTMMVWLAIMIALPVSLCSTWLVTMLYGPSFSEAGPVLLINVWAAIFVFIGVASSSWLTSENLQKHAFFRTLMGAIVNVVLNLNLILIPRQGLVGAALATLVAQMSAALFFDICCRRTRPMFFMKLKALNIANLFRGSW